MRVQVLDLAPSTYVPHRVHGAERMWLESNCAADLWIEVLHGIGLEPLAAMGFLLNAGFDGEQWRMFKFSMEDVWRLYGIDAYEVNLWRTLPTHLEDHIALGRMITIDLDAWWLPDTEGLTYKTAHQKTTVAVQMIDVEAGRIGYFHNGGYYELGGEEYERLIADEAVAVIPPYAEAIDLEHLRREEDLRPLALELAREHLARRPAANPVARCARASRTTSLARQGWDRHLSPLHVRVDPPVRVQRGARRGLRALARRRRRRFRRRRRRCPKGQRGGRRGLPGRLQEGKGARVPARSCAPG